MYKLFKKYYKYIKLKNIKVEYPSPSDVFLRDAGDEDTSRLLLTSVLLFAVEADELSGIIKSTSLYIMYKVHHNDLSRIYVPIGSPLLPGTSSHCKVNWFLWNKFILRVLITFSTMSYVQDRQQVAFNIPSFFFHLWERNSDLLSMRTSPVSSFKD